MSDKISGTSIDQKLKAKKAAHQIKYGSPKLRDLLREKCRIRCKGSRETAFNNSRNFSESQKVLLKSIIQEELNEDIELQDIVYKEILTNLDEWLIQELEQEEQYILNQYENNPVFCPVCQKSLLTANNFILECPCGVRLKFISNLEDFYSLIQFKIQDHGKSCNENLQFFTQPNGDTNLMSLHALCEYCSYYYLVLD